MRRKAQEITDPKILEKILQSGDVIRLAMQDGNRPYIIPLNYGYKNNHFYIHCAREGKKIDLLNKNNHVAFEIEEKAEIVKGVNACEWTTKFRSIIGYGNVEVIDDYDKKVEGLKIIMSHFGAPEQDNFETRYVESVLILKIKIIELTGKQSKVFEL